MYNATLAHYRWDSYNISPLGTQNSSYTSIMWSDSAGCDSNPCLRLTLRKSTFRMLACCTIRCTLISETSHASQCLRISKPVAVPITLCTSVSLTSATSLMISKLSTLAPLGPRDKKRLLCGEHGANFQTHNCLIFSSEPAAAPSTLSSALFLHHPASPIEVAL